ncbi:MAG: hypothetical protein NTX00_01940 [Candidatus Parcubacteria bacterium]|nr:hypothetical protein [Candidatus Parcubacteria bacterium]
MMTSQGRFKEDLRTIIINDFFEAIKRVKDVKFLPDRIEIELVFNHLAARDSILLRDIQIIGHDYTTPRMSLADEFLQKLVTFNYEKGIIILPFPNALKIIFLGDNKREIKSFGK